MMIAQSTRPDERGGASVIHIGVGGWNFAPWRGVFYPRGLPQQQELAYASRHLTSIEINSTFYGAQKPASFAKWHDATPDEFIFAVKAPRYATNRRVLGEAGESIERFLNGGVLLLRHKLGPINRQLPPTKRFDPADVEVFLSLLPRRIKGQALRHAIEARHESFNCPQFLSLAEKYGVAIVIAGDSAYPRIEQSTAPFIYARIMGTRSANSSGYTGRELDAWASRILQWSEEGREVFLYVISGFKERNPAAAMALIERLRPSSMPPDGESATASASRPLRPRSGR